MTIYCIDTYIDCVLGPDHENLYFLNESKRDRVLKEIQEDAMTNDSIIACCPYEREVNEEK